MFIFRRRKRRKLDDFLHLLVISIVFLSFSASSLSCNDNRCKTKSCNATGACICNLPDPSTLLDGDRPFFGGKFCDEELVMCDGTNSFWCEHGGTCNEIVHGENYTCNCQTGYTGERCQHSGAPCGPIFCFHHAECLIEDNLCECPPDWRGSIDCSLPTTFHKGTTTNLTTAGSSEAETSHNGKSFVVVLVVLCAIVAIAGVVTWGKKFFHKKETKNVKFQQLSDIQTHEYLDEDEDDSLVPAHVNDNSHL